MEAQKIEFLTVAILADDDTKEKGSLGILQTFGCVTHWPLGDWGNLEQQTFGEIHGWLSLERTVAIDFKIPHSKILINVVGEQPVDDLSFVSSEVDTFSETWMGEFEVRALSSVANSFEVTVSEERKLRIIHIVSTVN